MDLDLDRKSDVTRAGGGVSERGRCGVGKKKVGEKERVAMVGRRVSPVE